MSDRKKRKRFFKKQKRSIETGGGSSQVPADLLAYFINISLSLNSTKDKEEEMGVLSSNALQEINGNESVYCCDKTVSRVVEELLPYSSDKDFISFCENFSKDLRRVFCDRIGSHVLQQSLLVALKKYSECMVDPDREKLSEYMLRVSQFLLNNLDEFILNPYGNPVSRTVLNMLSGYAVKGELQPNTCEENKIKDIPDKFHKLFHKYVKRILLMPQMDNLTNQVSITNFVHYVVSACQNNEERSLVIVKVLSSYEKNPLDLKSEYNIAFLRLVETIVTLSKDSLKKIWRLMLKRNLLELALSKSGNFLVQKFINQCSAKHFEKIFEKLSPETEKILQVGHSGVLLALVKGCRRLEILQGKCLALLRRTFQVKETKELVPLIISLTPREHYDPENHQITLHGCLIIQELLFFKKPIEIVVSLLSIKEQDLVKLLCDSKGCHLSDALMASKNVGEKKKETFFQRVRGFYTDLAISKYGSRSLDAIWNAVGLKERSSIAEEFKNRQSELASTSYGKRFEEKMHLSHYRRNKDEWLSAQKSSMSARKLFSDLIPKKKPRKE